MKKTLLCLTAIFYLSGFAHASAGDGLEQQSFKRTEQRENCDNHNPLKQALFGDLHVHTAYSFDSYVSNQRNTPWDAYRFAKGEPITLSNAEGEQSLIAQLQRPLDFTAVTDHAEFLGQIKICTEDSDKLGYWWPYCIATRSSNFYISLLAADYWVNLGVTGTSNEKEKSFICSINDCKLADGEFWDNIQQAAEEHYDRSSSCQFTTFVGYEYTDAPNFKNLHRNVIFRNDNVTELPISTYETGTQNFPELWVRLREQCIDGDSGCDVMSIPHNPNLSGGLMFPDPKSEQEAKDRLFFEPVVELIQHKAASECRFDRIEGRGVGTEDELCDFEQVVADNLAMLGTVFGKVMDERGDPVPLEKFGRRNMMRNVLKDGLKLQRETGINPFKSGFIGSTDTHSAAPGSTEEDNYVGHLGRRDAGYRNVQDHFFDNPGGHAVVWAEENSRDSIFSSIRRRETYATSGTRPIIRFFGGWDIPTDICSAGNLVERAYQHGVPMGSDLPPFKPALNKQGNNAPRFLVTAMKDAGSPGHPGTDLQRIQIIKGWIDSEGNTWEKVIDVAGDPDNGASVDADTCAPVGVGYANLCTVWEDRQFSISDNAFYYLRVLENPSCRWTTLQCQAAGVNPLSNQCQAQADSANQKADDSGAIGDVYGKCCLDSRRQPFYSPIIQERAWTSPIWYRASASTE